LGVSANVWFINSNQIKFVGKHTIKYTVMPEDTKVTHFLSLTYLLNIKNTRLIVQALMMPLSTTSHFSRMLLRYVRLMT